MAVLAAVDLGAQSGRVATGRIDGEKLVAHEVHRFANEPIEDDGVLRWDVTQLRDEVWSGLRKVSRDDDVVSVAVDSWAVDFGLLDGAGRLLSGPAHYRNARRAGAFDGVLERVPARELYEI